MTVVLLLHKKVSGAIFWPFQHLFYKKTKRFIKNPSDLYKTHGFFIKKTQKTMGFFINRLGFL